MILLNNAVDVSKLMGACDIDRGSLHRIEELKYEEDENCHTD